MYRYLSTRKAFTILSSEYQSYSKLQTVQAQSQSQIKHLIKYWPKHGLTEQFHKIKSKITQCILKHTLHIVQINVKQGNKSLHRQAAGSSTAAPSTPPSF